MKYRFRWIIVAVAVIVVDIVDALALFVVVNDLGVTLAVFIVFVFVVGENIAVFNSIPFAVVVVVVNIIVTINALDDVAFVDVSALFDVVSVNILPIAVILLLFCYIHQSW